MPPRKTPIESEPVEPQMCTVDLRLEILSRVPFFNQLASQEIARINRLFHERGYMPGEAIYFASDPASHLYVVADGRVKLLRHTWSGKDVLLDILTPGEFFGSLSAIGDEEYPDTALAHTATCALRVDSEGFRQILEEYPSVAVRVLDITSQRLQEAYEMIRQLSAYPVEMRIAHTLLKLAEKLGQEREVGLLIQTQLSRDDLAEMAGTTTETASRIMSQFQKDGLIRSGRQWVAIRDLEALKGAVEGLE
jgi:CRP-like cAMP-binding protein